MKHLVVALPLALPPHAVEKPILVMATWGNPPGDSRIPVPDGT